MNKSEFIKAVVEAQSKKGINITQGQAESVLTSGFEVIRDAVKEEGKVQLIGFGTWTKTHKPERQGWNPSANKPMTLAAKDSVKFKASSTFLD